MGVLDTEGGRTGVWLVGARGNVGSLSVVGARAIARGRAGTTGMATAKPPLADVDLPPVEKFVFGGHDIATEPLFDRASAFCERNGYPDRDTLEAVRGDLDAIDERIVDGTAINCGNAVTATANPPSGGRTIHEIVTQLRSDYESFRIENDLDRVVVLNVASTEPPMAEPGRYGTRADVEAAIDADDGSLPASVLYAYAALVDGHPYVNFTPSTGSSLGGLRELASQENVPHMGRDAKTGETLVKSALAPMFAGRNLHVRSWEAHNILGNADGRVLEDEANAAGKLESKSEVLASILPDIEHDRVRIDYTPSLGDWKTAWDYVHFEGFLGTEMTMQFTWEGADSALAAPLVLDLARLVAHADRHGEGGLQPHLASFFKAPMGVDEHDLSRQFDRLYEYANRYR